MLYFLLGNLFRYRFTYFVFIGTGALLGGLFLLLDNYDRSMRHEFYETECKITCSEVTREQTGSRRHPHVTHYATIVYTYKVDGESYESDNYRAFDMGMNPTEAQGVCNRYPVGAVTKCYYDPLTPDFAVLTFESDRRPLNGIGILGMLAMLFGVGGWIVIDFILPAGEKVPKAPKRGADAQIPEWSQVARTVYQQRKES